MLTKAELYYFSPTGGTKKVGEIFCGGIARNSRAVDLGRRDLQTIDPEGGLVVLAAPVYGGRIPALVAERLKGVNGTGRKAVTLAVYGVRAYEDALLELNRVAEEQGFQVIASAAVVAQHSIVPEVGAGRPDDRDREEILAFAKKVLEKLESGTDSPVEVPGNYPYKDGMRVEATPVSLPDCTRCGVCEGVCPTGAVRLTEGAVATSLEKCILCMACTAACPEQARALPRPMQEGLNRKLGALKEVRRENEFFL